MKIIVQNKILNLLGLAQRAGKLIIGYDAVHQALVKHQLKVLIIAADISTNTEDKIMSAAKHDKKILVINNFTADELKQALGKKTKLIAIKDAGFNKAIKKLTK